MQRITVFKLTLNYRHLVTASSVLSDSFDIQCGLSQYLSVSQSCYEIGPQVEVSESINTVVLRDCVPIALVIEVSASILILSQ